MASESRFAGSAGILSSTVRVSTATTPTGIPPNLGVRRERQATQEHNACYYYNEAFFIHTQTLKENWKQTAGVSLLLLGVKCETSGSWSLFHKYEGKSLHTHSYSKMPNMTNSN